MGSSPALKMRILQVVHGFPPFNMAGAEVFAHGLSRALAALGHDVRVFHRVADPSRPEWAVERAEVDGLPVVRINNTFRECDRFERTYRNEAVDAAFGAYLDEFQPEIIHFHHVTCLSTNLIGVAKERGIPVVFTLHDYWLICQRGQFLKRDLSICQGQDDGECVKCLAWQLNLRGGPAKVSSVLKRTVPSLDTPSGARWKRWLKASYGLYARAFFASQVDARAKVRARMEHVRDMCKQVDLFIAPSRFLRQKFLEFGIPEARILYSTLGLDTSFYDHPRRAPDGKVRFGYIGTWIPPKGIHLLIEAFNSITDERASLHIYGHAVPYEGYEDYEEHLKRLVQSPRIHLEGRFDHQDVGKILAGIDVLVVPSIWYENSPLTIQEAFLAGIPVITARLGGMEELVSDPARGSTFAPRNPQDLREVIRSAITERLGGSAVPRQAAEVKSVARDAVAHVEWYASLAEGQPSARGGREAGTAGSIRPPFPLTR